MSRVRSPPISPANDDLDHQSQFSRTYSTSSSRNTHHSRSHSLASSNGRHNSISGSMEASARVFHTELKAYLASLLARGMYSITRKKKPAGLVFCWYLNPAPSPMGIILFPRDKNVDRKSTMHLISPVCMTGWTETSQE
jgi:hypothetical protein